ncbi:hypothetical protein HYN59_03470 [Flavobacterium album]|uniref:Uncharacterized protein n=1 Tax=Flavobacterium album TaxID=2175091 RepID=A0A2S1QUY0_9FLAO|nr:hypothetical protein [Flavobacterium album]AWH84228.1 hypothetical protein HYN59_03470 [Flavobacterium album]
MKLNLKAIILLLLISTAASAQTIFVNHADPATGSRVVQTNNQIGPQLDMDDSISKHGALFFAAGYQSATTAGKLVATYYIDLNIIHNDNRLGCLRQLESRIILTLEDGTKMECIQISDSDCDKAAFHAVFALMPKGGTTETMKQNFEKLINTGITEIKVITTEKELDYKIKKDFVPYLKKHFALIDKTVNGSAK